MKIEQLRGQKFQLDGGKAAVAWVGSRNEKHRWNRLQPYNQAAALDRYSIFVLEPEESNFFIG